MGLYERFVLPHAVNFVCGRRIFTRERAQLVRRASGVVLEVGFGSGLNLGYYSASQVERIWALEPSSAMWKLAESRVGMSDLPLLHLEAPAEEIPLDDESVDTAVLTYTLCSVDDPSRALTELRRVLRPGGELLFSEHGAAPDPVVRRWQKRLTPLWKHLAGGCHLDRDIPALITASGFSIDELSTGYLPTWRPASFNYRGRAARGGRETLRG